MALTCVNAPPPHFLVHLYFIQLDANGWLTPVVNPEDWSSSGAQSPEGQAFVVEMQAAWQDWVAKGSPGANAAQRLAFGSGAPLFTVFIGVMLVLFLI